MTCTSGPISQCNSRTNRQQPRLLHRPKLCVYRLCNNVQNALKQQLLLAVDNIYVRTLRNKHIGYAGVSVIQILEHLYRTYGRLTPIAMMENGQDHLVSLYNPAEPFKMLIQQIEEDQIFASHGCVLTFTGADVRITNKRSRLVMRGLQDPTNNLWTIPLQPPAPCYNGRMIDECMEDEGLDYVGFNMYPQNSANSVYHTPNLVEHIQFLHAACGYPVPSTWTQAINQGHSATWPGLTGDLTPP
jgi:hypothetical protein